MKRATVMILAAGLLLAAENPKDGDAEKERKKLQGNWVATALEQNGDKVPAEQVEKANFTLAIKGDAFTFTTPKGKQEGKLRIDPAKKPRSINFTGTSPEGKKSTILGIYEWEGKNLKIASDRENRPTEFKSRKDGPLVMTFTRKVD